MKDISTWTQYEYLNWFNRFTESDWEEYISYAEQNGFDHKQISILKRMQFSIGRPNKAPSFNQLASAYNFIHAITISQQRANMPKPSGELKHVTIRVAWHDNKWNGKICKDPAQNIYCNGYHSLLSARLRSRKRVDLEIKYPEQEIECFNNESEKADRKYIPPCFWSINAFGDSSIVVCHDNPALPVLDHIKETLPPHSVFSWPFALSFVRDADTWKADGKYPKNLESVRIPYFQEKLHEKESIVFLYANYDNPISGDEPGDTAKYLVIGCGFLKEKGSINRFERPAKAFEDIKNHNNGEYRNFPHINWALRYTLDYPEGFIVLPYHEYLQDAEISKDDTKLNEIKVTIDEKELIHCFKYVAMDIDHDEAIFILSKIRQKLYLAKNHGIVNQNLLKNDIDKIDQFLKFCWEKRGHFPGFKKVSRIVLGRDAEERLSLDGLVEKVKENEGIEYADKLVELLNEPASDIEYKQYKNDLLDLKEHLEDSKGISINDFLVLSMLNLTFFQFTRILKGNLRENIKRSINDICSNPYLLYEEYESEELKIDPNTGEQIDFPIELFKIDIAFFPDTRHGMQRINCQRDIRLNDKRRIRAVVIQHLCSLENVGDCFDDADNIQEGLKSYPLFYKIGQDYELPENFLSMANTDFEKHLVEKLEIIISNDTKYYYLKDLYQAEQSVSAIIQKLLSKLDHDIVLDNLNEYINDSCDKLLKLFTTDFPVNEFKEERSLLYSNALKKNLFVIAGSAGSGKSYELMNIISILDQKGENYILLAPTGKATLRLSTDQNFPQIKAKTIDKFIADISSRHENPSMYNNIIIDEMSMVDIVKFDKLLNFFNFDNPSLKRMILVGDQFQLPPIGFGKPYIDIIEYIRTKEEFNNNFIELEVNCRQDMGQKVIEFGKIYTGQNIDFEPLLQEASSGKLLTDRFRIQYWKSKEELFNLIFLELLKFKITDDRDLEQTINRLLELAANGKIIEKSNGRKFNVDGIQLLSPYKSGYFGTLKLNHIIQHEIKKNEPLLEMGSFSFKNADKVIQTKNKYEHNQLMLSNGSMGLVLSHGKNSKFYFPEKNFEPLNVHDLDDENIEPAFCITVHKSQGSGFDNVLLIMPKKQSLLSKELFYTALTRSKASLSILLEGSADDDYASSILEKIRLRSFTELRKTSLLGLPFWDFTLEPEKGVYVKSRSEFMIYDALLEFRQQYAGFHFIYEQYPVIGTNVIKIKTDFTIYTDTGKMYYWEHLGLLGNRYYEKKWKRKLETYRHNNLIDHLITTDEVRGIAREKIKMIIEDMRNGLIKNEDKHNKYSTHHYHLR